MPYDYDRRSAARKRKAPTPAPVQRVKVVADYIDDAFGETLKVDAEGEIQKHLTLKPGNRENSYEDGTLSRGRDLGYSFAQRYPSYALVTSFFDVDLHNLPKNLAKVLEWEEVTATQEDIDKAIKDFDFERPLKEMAIAAFPDSYMGVNDWDEKVEPIDQKSYTSSISAYSEEEGEVELPEYPNIYFQWGGHQAKAPTVSIKQLVLKFRVTVSAVWSIDVRRWDFEEDARRW